MNQHKQNQLPLEQDIPLTDVQILTQERLNEALPMLVMVNELDRQVDLAPDRDSGLPQDVITVKPYKMNRGDQRGMGVWALERAGQPTVRLNSVPDLRRKEDSEGSFLVTLTAANEKGEVGPLDDEAALQLASVLASVAQGESVVQAVTAHNEARKPENTQHLDQQNRGRRLARVLGRLRSSH